MIDGFRRTIAATIVAMAGLLAGCAATPETDRLLAGGNPAIHDRVELEDVPFFPQTPYHCGPAALATVYSYEIQTVSPDTLASTVFTPGRQGALQSDMITAARRSGGMALSVGSMESAFQAVADGRPVLILQNLGLEIAPAWHYAVLVGYDLNAGTAVLRSGTERRRIVAIETLEHTWRRSEFWGRVVQRPDRPPPDFVSMDEWIREAAGLERSGHDSLAEVAYRQGLKRWPDAALPWTALANLRFKQGRLESAAANFRKALKRDPEDAAVLNNLAFLLLEQGRPSEALPFAEKAVSIGGPVSAEAEKTLMEIRAVLRDTADPETEMRISKN